MRASKRVWRRLIVLAVCSLILVVFGHTVTFAQDAADPATMADLQTMQMGIDTTWVLITGFLVFFMQTGFAMLEAGFVRHTGVVNALLENFFDAGMTAIIFWAVGFGIAFGTDGGGIIGTDNFFLTKP